MRWEKVQLGNPQAQVAQQLLLSEIACSGPGKRWGHTCNAIKGGRFLYVFGGYGKDIRQTNQVHVFDTGTFFYFHQDSMFFPSFYISNKCQFLSLAFWILFYFVLFYVSMFFPSFYISIYAVVKIGFLSLLFWLNGYIVWLIHCYESWLF